MSLIKTLPFGPGALWVVGIYVLSLLGIGYLGYIKRKEESPSDFYLAGREMGFLVLLLTLYATQYSGNTLFGFSGAAYRNGLGFLVCLHFMTAIVVAYLLYAPALFKLSRKHKFVTPADFIAERFKHRTLQLIVTLIMLFVLCNFVIAQMKALGTAFEGISQGRIPMSIGVIGLAIVMLAYETLGGMRSVAWPDAIQGVILLIGFALILALALVELGSLPEAVAILANNPETVHKITRPDPPGCRYWLSFILLVGFGGAIYPQAIQRIYAAGSIRVLKKSLSVMAFMPLATTLVVVTIGTLMAAYHPDLGRQVVSLEESSNVNLSETVLPQLCLQVMQSSILGYWLVVVIFAAVITAIMSTADSAILSISSMVTHDVYKPYLKPNASERHLTLIGRLAVWILILPLVWIALEYKGNLIRLIEIKFEMLIQCVPTFFLGCYWRRLGGRTLLIGIVVGCLISLGLTFSGSLGLSQQNYKTLWGFHSGIIGLAANLLICSTAFFQRRAQAFT